MRAGLSAFLLFVISLSNAAPPMEFSKGSLEEALYEDAADGVLNRLSLEQAVFIASGVSQKELPSYIQKIDSVYNKMAVRWPMKSLPPLQRGQVILNFLHKNIFKSYEASATEVQKTLDTGRFNCVSSTLLFNILCERFGLSTESVEVPTHLYAVLKTPERNFRVETTIPNGFFDIHSRLNEFIYNRLIQTWKGKRTVNDVTLIAVIYYNRGLPWIRDKNYAGALPFYQRAYQLDAQFPDLSSLILDLYTSWGNVFFENQDYEKAAHIYEKGAAFLKSGDCKSSSALKGNLTAALINTANSEMRRKHWAQASSLLQKAQTIGPLQSMIIHNQKVLFYNWGEDRIQEKMWPEALRIYQTARKIFPQEKGFRQNLIWTYAKIGEDFLKKGQTQEALAWFHQAYQETREPTFNKACQWLKKA